MIFEIYTPWAQKQNPIILNQAQQSEESLHKDIDFSLHSFAQNDKIFPPKIQFQPCMMT